MKTLLTILSLFLFVTVNAQFADFAPMPVTDNGVSGRFNYPVHSTQKTDETATWDASFIYVNTQTNKQLCPAASCDLLFMGNAVYVIRKPSMETVYKFAIVDKSSDKTYFVKNVINDSFGYMRVDDGCVIYIDEVDPKGECVLIVKIK